ncbi:MAG: tRNA (adenosine(37)-N6)-threonylcarbamoyltransferase complex transferase subunit TsaD [Clostridiales bacterium]|nr:tRNA (adenosine(37)-N6)-threonylcarbamoyltransferase complex transferase subunit TsaD [Clostridiales bacterium]
MHDYINRMRRQAADVAEKKDVRILAIETSCDETAGAVVQNGRSILSNVIHSQVEAHRVYGGVVPEIASRAHVEVLDQVIEKTLLEAGIKSFDDMDAVAVTAGPGLVGALLAGVSYAKGLAFALDKPLVAVNHIEAHICANYLTHADLEPPFICLVASGGHSHLYHVQDYDQYRLLGCTQDDAAGEAFDKSARVLGLPYPGGPNLDVLAETGSDAACPLPRARVEGKYDFSFSGIKTAFINLVHAAEQKGQSLNKADLAASFRRAVVDQLLEKTMLAAADIGEKAVAVAGGVSANRLLRHAMQQACMEQQHRLYLPELALCGDNAAMVGAAAYHVLKAGAVAGLQLNAQPSLRMI